jgi:hypothetical protein
VEHATEVDDDGNIGACLDLGPNCRVGLDDSDDDGIDVDTNEDLGTNSNHNVQEDLDFGAVDELCMSMRH